MRFGTATDGLGRPSYGICLQLWSFFPSACYFSIVRLSAALGDVLGGFVTSGRPFLVVVVLQGFQRQAALLESPLAPFYNPQHIAQRVAQALGMDRSQAL